VAHEAGLTTANKRWCEVDWLTMESIAARNIHVLGDSVQIAPAMPKSGHMANQHGKVAAAAIVALLAGRAPNPAAVQQHLLQLRERHRRGARGQRAPLRRRQEDHAAGAGLGRVSPAASELEGRYAMAWARNIWADTLA
jgi:hypothetical protein